MRDSNSATGKLRSGQCGLQLLARISAASGAPADSMEISATREAHSRARFSAAGMAVRSGPGSVGLEEGSPF